MLAFPQATEERVELVARDREHVGAKARVTAKRIARLDARGERPLHEVVRIAADLVLQKPIDVTEVAAEQILSRTLIAGTPAF